MDGTQTGQNNSQGGNNDKKTQLSWSQPVTTPSKPAVQKETPKTVSPMQQTPAAKPNTTFRNSVIVVVLLAAIGIVWMTLASNKPSSTMATQAGTAAMATTTQTTTTSGATVVTTSDGAVSIPTPQAAGLEIAVSNVNVTVPTWVVIYENYNGQPGNVLGAGLFTSDRHSGVVDLLRGTLPGQTYFAGESRDDGDHMYSIDNDPAVRDTNGNPIWVKFQTN